MKSQRLLIALILTLSLPAFPVQVLAEGFGVGKGNPFSGEDTGAFGAGKVSPEPAPIEPESAPQEAYEPITEAPAPLADPVDIPVPAPAIQPAPMPQPRQSIPIAPPPVTAYRSPEPVTPTYKPVDPGLRPAPSLPGLPPLPGQKQIPVGDITIRYPLTAKAPVTSRFGWRTDPIYGGTAYHGGLDLGAPTGAPVVTANSGTVVKAGWCGGYGYCVKINHGGFTTLYAHLSKVIAQPNMKIGSGQILGHVGSTGKSTGPHLHFGVIANGKELDPQALLAQSDRRQAQVKSLDLQALLPQIIKVAYLIS